MAFAKGYNQISFKSILDEVSEESLLEFYTGISQCPSVVSSPLRIDKHPSFGVYYSTNGIDFIDYASGESGSLIDLLKLKLNLDLDSLKIRIIKDLNEIKNIDKYIIRQNKDTYTSRQKDSKSIKTRASLNVKVRDWEEHDLKFWESFGISIEWLKFGNIFPISHVFLNNSRYPADKYAYCFVEFKDGITTLKVYQPYSDKQKWLNNHGPSVWDLWQQVMSTNSDKLIITSSRKDALCLWANTGIPSTSLQAEGYLPKPHVVSILTDKFPTIYCFYDNDFNKPKNYGREYGKKLSELYEFKQLEIPEEYHSKDPSDLYKNHGSKEFNKVLNSILI